MSTINNIEQERAQLAWNQVQALKPVTKEYLSLVRGAASMIMINGLGQTLAFYLSKAKSTATPHEQIATHFAERLLSDLAQNERVPVTLMAQLVSGDHTRYRRYTTEALAYVGWLKRFAESASHVQDREANAKKEVADAGGNA